MKKITSVVFLFLAITAAFSQAPTLVKSQDLIVKGIELHDAEKYNEAIETFLKVPVNDTNYVLMLVELVNTYIAADKDSLALIAAEEGLKYPSEYEISLRLFKANALDNLDRFDEAMAVYDQGQKDFPRSHVFYYEKGIALSKKSRWKEANDLFIKTISINPYYHPAHYQMASMAIRQGKYIPAMLAWQYYLLFDNSSKRASLVISSLEQMAKVEYEAKDVISIPGQEGKDDFAELEAIVKSKIALSDKYKCKLKVNYAVVKQLQLIVEKIAYDKNDDGFYNQHYAKFFAELNKNKMIEPYLLSIFSGSSIEDINKMAAKKKPDIEKFNKWAAGYIHDNHEVFEDEISGVKGSYGHYYGGGKLTAIGNMTNSKHEGKWNYFHSTSIIKSEGNFVNGEREGIWQFYFPTGGIKEKTNYKNGVVEGETSQYYKSGGIQSRLNIKNNQLDGKQESFFPVGTKKGVYPYVNGKPDGKTTTFYSNGQPREEYTITGEKVEGEFKEFSKHGRLTAITRFKAGLKQGACEGYWDNDKKSKRFEGTYTDDKPSGKWTYYYENGTVETSGEYVKGQKSGRWILNYRNGVLQSEEEYANGELNGSYKTYSKTGKPLEEFTYKNGILQQFKQYDAAGKEIASGKREKKELNIVLFHENGNKRREGIVHDNKPEGEWKDFDVNGNVTAVSTYKQGLLQGTQTSFHENGAKSRVTNYKDDQPDGLFQEFTEKGTVISEGNYANGQQQGTWKYYFKNGTLKKEYYFLNGDLTGWQKHYDVNGKISYEDYYIDGFMAKIMYYDTASVVRDKCEFPQGSGEIVSHSTKDGDLILKGTYKASFAEGDFYHYYLKDKISSITAYKADEQHGKEIHYDIDGNITYEAEYFENNIVGKAKYFYPGGKIKEEVSYENGEREGPDIEYYENGKVKTEFHYKDGQIDGETKFMSEDGSLIYSRIFDNGRILSYSYMDKTNKPVTVPLVNENGKYKAYFSNGNASLEGEFINGLRNGTRKIWFPNGKVSIEENFLNGNLDGKGSYYYPSGKLMAVKNYNLGDNHGAFTYYYENGKTQKEENYVNNEEHGLFKYYNTEGKLVKTRLYHAGILIKETNL